MHAAGMAGRSRLQAPAMRPGLTRPPSPPSPAHQHAAHLRHLRQRALPVLARRHVHDFRVCKWCTRRRPGVGRQGARGEGAVRQPQLPPQAGAGLSWICLSPAIPTNQPRVGAHRAGEVGTAPPVAAACRRARKAGRAMWPWRGCGAAGGTARCAPQQGSAAPAATGGTAAHLYRWCASWCSAACCCCRSSAGRSGSDCAVSSDASVPPAPPWLGRAADGSAARPREAAGDASAPGADAAGGGGCSPAGRTAIDSGPEGSGARPSPPSSC